MSDEVADFDAHVRAMRGMLLAEQDPDALTAAIRSLRDLCDLAVSCSRVARARRPCECPKSHEAVTVCRCACHPFPTGLLICPVAACVEQTAKPGVSPFCLGHLSNPEAARERKKSGRNE